MAFDRFYYFEKAPSNRESYGLQRYRYYYGEIQTNFNMSFVIDGTKDSCKVQVNNNDSKELDPLTIVWLESTNTWWVVKSDKVTRYANENGSYYTHEVSLYGAFEILNARDLINCGFNANRYTILEFFERLESFMDFEFPIIWNFGNYVDEEQMVTYLKTFQNYTPASAIKEMFNGMNLIPKLTFNTSGSGENIYIVSAEITPYSKSGSNETPLDISIFDNEEEQCSSDIESFGTRVISNIQNCVSADPIRYPVIGGLTLRSDDPTVGTDNGFITVPSAIYKVNKLIIGRLLHITLMAKDDFGVYGTVKYIDVNPLSYNKDTLLKFMKNSFSLTNSEWEQFESIYDNFYDDYKSVGIYELENGGSYNRIDSTWNEPYLQVNATPTQDHGNKFEITLNDKAYGTTAIYNEKWSTWWEQGSNKIENFKWLNELATSFPAGSSTQDYVFDNEKYKFYASDFTRGINIDYTMFAVEYVPMDDVKVKVDNDKEQNDSNLYNQNGKLVDSVAISKLINSHAVEISSNEITRYKVVRSFSDVPKPSRIVINGNDRYIINNVSVDFYENDDDHYFIIYQVTMTKQIACKSTMISANTNIRDYDCPQQNNVPRIQLYRDYIEFDYEVDNNDTPYLSLSQTLNFTNTTKGLTDNHACVFCVDDTYFYQIGTSKYNLNKQFIEIANFKDNNIIGYEAGKSYRVFQIQNMIDIFRNVNLKYINTPISYVDSIGELTSLKLLFVDAPQLETAYEVNGGLELAGKFVSVPTEVWTYLNSNENNYDILINEPNYKKDGLEVPVFEYSCQVGDANGIVFGADFLKGRSGTSIKYYYKVVDNVAPITQENATLYMVQGIEMTTLPSLSNNELTLTLTSNSSNIKGKNVVFWCEIIGEESSTYSHIYQTNSYFSNYDDGNQTIMLPAHSPNSTFELVDYIIASSEHTIDAIARIDDYDYDANTIDFTLAEPRSTSETIDGILSFQARNENYISTRVNYYYGTTQQISMGTQNREQTVIVGSVYCGTFDINSDGWVSDPVVLTFSAIQGKAATFGSNNSVNDIIIRIDSSGTSVRVIFWRRNRGSTGSSTNVTAYYQEPITGYETTLITSGGAISNYSRGATIPSSGIPNYENSIIPFGTPNQFRITVYTYDQPQSGDYIMISYYAWTTETYNIEVSGNGGSSPQTFSVASYGSLIGTPTIRLIGDPTDPVVNIVSLNQNTGELVYNAYDNDDHSFDVGVVFRYKETTNAGTIRDFLFAVNDCKIDATSSLTLKVNNWKLK